MPLPLRCLALLLIGPFTGAALAQSVGTIQSFDAEAAVVDWRFSPGAEWPGATGSLGWRDPDGPTGGAAVLAFDFTGGGHYVAAVCPLPADPPVRAVRLRLHKPAGNKLIFRAMDAERETFQKDFLYHYPGWQRLEITLDRWLFSWGGDGAFQDPPQEFHILVENEGGERVGELLIDDVELLAELPPAEPQPDAAGDRIATYTESDFRGRDPWYYAGPSTGGFDGGVWNYAFGDDAPINRLNRDRSILGRPEHVRLTIESDGSGHEVRMRLGSHFQLFETTLGRLDERGEVTLSAPLGDLKTWAHFAGEDDGIVRYPLRIVDISLHATGEPRAGKLRFERLAFETRHEPATETVWIEPDAHESDDGVAFPVTVRSLAAQPIRGELVAALHTGDSERGQEARPLELPPAGERVHVDFAAPWLDASVLEGRFVFRGERLTSREVATTLARVPDRAVPTELDPDSRMGVGMYLYRFHQHPQRKEWMERMCRVAAQAGVRWTREEFHWNWIEAREGEYDFTFFDELVDTAERHGISVYALCAYWTAWTEPCTEQGFDDYCRYLEALVRRYGDRIKYWEIWNEPNIFFWNCTRAQYAELLARAYETIKRVDPDAHVLGCSTAGIDTEFIKLVQQRAPFDALTIHPYRGQLQAGPFIDELRAVRAQVNERDVWITEMGWPSNIGALSERDQARYVARTYLAALGSGAVRNVSWYDFREDGDDHYYNEHNFGLVRGDLRPKIGYRALAAVGNLLGGAEVERQLDLDPELIAFQFRRGARRIVTLWSPERTRLVRLAFDGERPAAVNMVGDPADVGWQDHAATVLLTRATPMYFVGDGPLRPRLLDPPLELSLSRPAVHPGESVRLEVVHDGDIEVKLEPPPGWTLGSDAAGDLTAPDDAVPGAHTIRVRVEAEGRRFTIPVEVEVVAELLRG